MDYSRRENYHEVTISRDRLRGLFYGAAVGEALATSSSSRSPGHWGHATGVALAATQALIEAEEEEYSIEDALEGRGRAEYVQRLAKDWDTLVIIKRKIRLGNQCPPCSAAELPLRVAPAVTFLSHRGVDEAVLVDFLAAIASATNPHKFAIVPAVELSIILLAILKDEDRIPALFNDWDFLLPTEEPLSSLKAYGQEDLTDLSGMAGLQIRETVLGALGIVPGEKWSSPPSFKAAVLKAAIRSFDRGAAGALTGMMLGARHGMNGIPAALLDGLRGEITVDFLSGMLSNWLLLGHTFEDDDEDLPQADLTEEDRNQDLDPCSDSVNHIIYDIIDESLVYLDKEYALDLLNVKRVVHACEEARITWGEFKNRHPQVFEEVYKQLNDVGLLTLEEWFDKYGDGYALGVEDLTESELEEVKLTYRNHNKGCEVERLPLMDERFEVSGWYIDFFDDWFQGGLRQSWCLPGDILDEYGEEFDPIMAHMYTVIAPEHEQVILEKLEERGYVVERNPQLIGDVFYS